MNLIRKAWNWLITAHRDTTQEQLRDLADQVEDNGQQLRSMGAEYERKAHEAALSAKPDLTDDPQTEVPAFHPGVVSQLDISKPLPVGEEAPETRTRVQPSDWDLLSASEKELFEQISPHDLDKEVRYPAPVELSTADWVTGKLEKAGFSDSYHRRFAAFRRVGIGMSMRHLDDLKRRAIAQDESLSVHDLIALRSRGIA